MRTPWIVVGPQGVSWLGLADSEDQAWCIALGWPDKPEIEWHKANGWYATQPKVTWTKEQS